MTDEQKEIKRGKDAQYRNKHRDKIRAYEVNVRQANRKQKRAALEATPEWQEWRKRVDERKAAAADARQRTLQRQQARPGKELKRNLACLAQVIKGIRGSLLFPEKNRVRSIAAWNKTGVFKRRKKVLERAYRIQFTRRQRDLERAARRAFTKTPRVRRSDEEKKLIRSLRRRFEKALKAHRGSSIVFEMAGISLQGLRKHLESLFQPGMTWENYGFYGWHIDHIRPCAAFELYIPEQQRRCFHYTNLQPMWAKDNLAKAAKF